MPNYTKWSPEMEQKLKDNAHIGVDALMSLMPEFTKKGIKKKASLLGISIKNLTREKKPDTTEKFSYAKHVIKNNSTDGKIAVFIPEEKMTIFCKPGSDIDHVLSKFKNRHHDYNN